MRLVKVSVSRSTRRFIEEGKNRPDAERALVNASKFRDTIDVLDFIRASKGWVSLWECAGYIGRPECRTSSRYVRRIFHRLVAAGFIEWEHDTRTSCVHAIQSNRERAS